MLDEAIGFEKQAPTSLRYDDTRREEVSSTAPSLSIRFVEQQSTYHIDSIQRSRGKSALPSGGSVLLTIR
jgi:hypothetical protein